MKGWMHAGVESKSEFTMVFDEDRVIAAADCFEFVANVIADDSQHDGKGECPQQEDGIHQDEAGGVVLRQHIHTCKGQLTSVLLCVGRLTSRDLRLGPWLDFPKLRCCLRSVVCDLL